jgi:hypothetical protein
MHGTNPWPKAGAIPLLRWGGDRLLSFKHGTDFFKHCGQLLHSGTLLPRRVRVCRLQFSFRITGNSTRRIALSHGTTGGGCNEQYHLYRGIDRRDWHYLIVLWAPIIQRQIISIREFRRRSDATAPRDRTAAIDHSADVRWAKEGTQGFQHFMPMRLLAY